MKSKRYLQMIKVWRKKDKLLIPNSIIWSEPYLHKLKSLCDSRLNNFTYVVKEGNFSRVKPINSSGRSESASTLAFVSDSKH